MRDNIPKRLRFSVLERDGFRCQYCGKSVKDGAKLHVDHKQPVSRGGKTVMKNLVTSCQSCNSGKSDRFTTYEMGLWKTILSRVFQWIPYRVIVCDVVEKHLFIEYKNQKRSFDEWMVAKEQKNYEKFKENVEVFDQWIEVKEEFENFLTRPIVDTNVDIYDRAVLICKANIADGVSQRTFRQAGGFGGTDKVRRIMDRLEKNGIIGGKSSNQKRKVLISDDQPVSENSGNL